MRKLLLSVSILVLLVWFFSLISKQDTVIAQDNGSFPPVEGPFFEPSNATAQEIAPEIVEGPFVQLNVDAETSSFEGDSIVDDVIEGPFLSQSDGDAHDDIPSSLSPTDVPPES